MSEEILMKDYEDLSTESGFQFRFHCERCGVPHVSHLQPCVCTEYVLAGAVGDLLVEEVGSDGGNGGPDLSGPEHRAALLAAIAEITEHLHECPRCGKWVCDACWNRRLLMCERCGPSSDGVTT